MGTTSERVQRGRATEEAFVRCIRENDPNVKKHRQTDLRIYCRDGFVDCHQIILGKSSPMIKSYILSKHELEVEVVDWNMGQVILRSFRKPNEVTLILSETGVQEVRNLLSVLYSGEVIMNSSKDLELFREVWNLLGIKVTALKDLVTGPVISKPLKRKCEKNGTKKSKKKKLEEKVMANEEVRPKRNHRVSETDQNDLNSTAEPKSHSCEICHEELKLTINPKHPAKGAKGFLYHMLKHFRESQYFHIPPNLPQYFCTYSECQRKPFKRWYTFAFHLAWQHKEFSVRLVSRIKDLNAIASREGCSASKTKEVEQLRRIKRFCQDTQLFKKIDWNDRSHITTEREIFEAYEKCSDTRPPILCNLCGDQFSSPEFAAMHFCSLHWQRSYNAYGFSNDFLRSMDDGWPLDIRCSKCDFKTKRKVAMLGHIGMVHRLFKEIDLPDLLCGFDLEKTFKERPEDIDDIPVDVQNGQDPELTYACQVCQPAVKLEFAEMVKHLEVHRGERIMVSCENCLEVLEAAHTDTFRTEVHECKSDLRILGVASVPGFGSEEKNGAENKDDSVVEENNVSVEVLEISDESDIE